MNDSVNTEVAPAPAGLTPGKGLLVLGGVVAVVGGFIGLNAVLGIQEFWGGFLFLLWWSSVEQMKFDRLPACIIGAFVGLLLAFLLHTLPVWLGPSVGSLVFLGLILVSVYCLIMSWLSIAINMMAMLFLTVGTVPAVQAATDFRSVFASLVLGIVFFVGLLALGNFLRRKKVGATVST